MSTNPIFNALRATDPYEQLIANIISFESQPLRDLELKRGSAEAYKDVLGNVDSSLSALHTLVKSFTESFSNPFAARIAHVPEESAFAISVSDAAAFGSHAIRVDRLAATDQRVSAQFRRDGTDLRDFFDTNGEQTFSIEIASPTAEDRRNRVSIDVTVNAVGATDEEILDEIDQAIAAAVDNAVQAGEIRSSERPATDVMNETSDVARFSIRAGETGYDSRLAFTDSTNGLLQLLDVTSTSVVVETEPPIIPPTSATVTGAPLGGLTLIDNSNNTLEIEINGQARTVQLDNGNQNGTAIRDNLRDLLGPEVTVNLDGGSLVIETTSTGSGASIQITGGSAVDVLGFTVMAAPEYGEDETRGLLSGGMITDVGTSETNSALNARLLINGLTVYRSSNQIADAIDGVTIDLLETSAVAEEFVVDSDTESIRGELDSFIEKYNSIISLIKEQTFIDGDLNARGALANDSTFTGLRFGLRAAVTGQVTGQTIGAPSFLGDLGIEIGDDGTLSISDEEKLTEAVKTDAGAVQSFFDGPNGVATRLETMIDTYVGSNGVIGFREDAIDQRIKGYDNRIDTLTGRLERRETQLRREFAQLQEVLATLGGQQQFLTSLFG